MGDPLPGAGASTGGGVIGVWWTVAGASAVMDMGDSGVQATTWHQGWAATEVEEPSEPREKPCVEGDSATSVGYEAGYSWTPRVSAPSTTRLVPLTRRERRLARKTTGPATSSGVPM